MRIERAITDITTLGPGKRLVIWTNGCPRRCPGCESKRLQIADPQTEVDVTVFIKDFDLTHIDGVTISGGEPFMQESELYKMLKLLKDSGVNDILVYTGYKLEEIQKDPHKKQCLQFIDVLIDGEYIDELNDDTDNMRGSSNQQIYYLNPSIEEKYLKYHKKEREVAEYHIANLLISVGIPTKKYVEDFKKGGNDKWKRDIF